MSVVLLNAGLLSAIALLIIFLLGLSAFQNWSVRKHHAASMFVSKAAPIARWLLGLVIVAYVIFIAFQMQYQSAGAMR
jgi:hypothetical protein